MYAILRGIIGNTKVSIIFDFGVERMADSNNHYPFGYLLQ